MRAMFAPARRRAAALAVDLFVVLFSIVAAAIVAELAFGATLGWWAPALAAAYFVDINDIHARAAGAPAGARVQSPEPR
jgi:hypothetical protein